MASGDNEQSHKVHRSRQAGASAKKKSDKKKKNQESSDAEKKQNPKVAISPISMAFQIGQWFIFLPLFAFLELSISSDRYCSASCLIVSSTELFFRLI